MRNSSMFQNHQAVTWRLCWTVFFREFQERDPSPEGVLVDSGGYLCGSGKKTVPGSPGKAPEGRE